MSEPADDLATYLRRLGLAGRLNPSLASLRRLQRAHLEAVPFENASVLRGEPIVLETAALVDKVVRRGRGGFCFELNGAFAWLLRTRRLRRRRSCRAGSGRIAGSDRRTSTLALGVDPGWGARSLVDVGAGYSFLEPLRLAVGLEQDDPSGTFRIVARPGRRGRRSTSSGATATAGSDPTTGSRTCPSSSTRSPRSASSFGRRRRRRSRRAGSVPGRSAVAAGRPSTAPGWWSRPTANASMRWSTGPSSTPRSRGGSTSPSPEPPTMATMRMLRVALVQLEARDDVDANLAKAAAMADEAAAARPDLVVLPEYVQFRGSDDGLPRLRPPDPGSHDRAVRRDRPAARDAGSSPVRHAELSDDPRRPWNTAVLFDREGRLAATYRKLHLFDVAVDDGPADSESARVTAGDRAVVASLDDTRLGLSICYDLRFPELYRALALAGAEILAVPAVFTARTGRDHWEVLLRARAIENGAWVVAAAGCGAGGPGAIPAWGHSLVVDPWGRVVADGGGRGGDRAGRPGPRCCDGRPPPDPGAREPPPRRPAAEPRRRGPLTRDAQRSA